LEAVLLLFFTVHIMGDTVPVLRKWDLKLLPWVDGKTKQ